MNKSELLENYTAEQLADMFIKAYSGDSISQIVVNIGGLPKIYTIQEIEEIVTACEEIKMCQEQNAQCKTALPAEYLKILNLNQVVSKLQAKVDKYQKAFEDAKKERDCQIAEYQKKIEELENHHKFSMMQIDDVLMEFLGVTHEVMDKPSEFEKVLQEVIDKSKTVSDFLPAEPIKVADMLIDNATAVYENYVENFAKSHSRELVIGNPCEDVRRQKLSYLRQIAKHLLVYCEGHESEE